MCTIWLPVTPQPCALLYQVSREDWAKVVRRVVSLDLPWYRLAAQLAEVHDGHIHYMEFLDRCTTSRRAALREAWQRVSLMYVGALRTPGTPSKASAAGTCGFAVSPCD